MKVYVITQLEMDNLREKLKLAWLEHCERYGLKPNLMNDPSHHDYHLFAHFNMIYCRWMSDVTSDGFIPDLRPAELK